MLAAAPERGKWGRKGGKFGKAAAKSKGGAKAQAAPSTDAPAPVKLAAKGKKTAVNKQAPVKKPAAPAAVKPKAKASAKKRPAKKKA